MAAQNIYKVILSGLVILFPSITLADQSFSSKSGSINVTCDQTGTASASFTLPPGSTVKTMDARWIDLSNIKDSNYTVDQSGSKVTAKGSIRGLDKESVMGINNCPGGGHGTLELYGSYGN